MQEAGSLAPGRLESAGAVARRDGLAAGGRRGARVRPRGRRTPVRRRDRHGCRRRRGRSPPRRSDRRGGQRAVVGRRAVRADRRPAPGRGAVPDLHERAARRALSILGRRPGGALRVLATSTSSAWRSACRTSTPTARSHLVAKGMLNGTRRSSLTDPQPMDPGAVVPLTIHVDATGWRFGAGHRIRVVDRRRRLAERLADAGTRHARAPSRAGRAHPGSRCRSSPTRAPSRRPHSRRRPWSRVTPPPSTRPPAGRSRTMP